MLAEAALRALHLAGRQAWPEIDLPIEELARYLEERTEASVDPARAPDLCLACACLLRLPQALAAFDVAIISQVPSFVARIDASAPFCDEVSQIVRSRLLVDDGERRPKLADYSGRGALASWVRVVAIRTALDLKRMRCDKVGAEEVAENWTLATTSNPELDYLRTRYASEIGQLIADAVATLGQRERTLLRLSLVDGATADAIGRLYEVHRVTVARWLALAREQLSAECMRLVRERFRLSPTELDSLLGLVRSQLDLSVRHLFATRDRTP